MRTPKKQLPIGIQTLSKLRQNDECYYVDKTPKIIEMIGKSDYIFLSRPRRFGKSLTLDTVAELFCANKDLFIGLYAENHWDWTVKHPVIRISFGGNVSFDEQYLQRIFNEKLLTLEEQYNMTNTDQELTVAGRFGRIIRHCHISTGQKVVVLVDEYDKPILDNLMYPDKAIVIRDQMKEFYAVIKDSDKHIRFAMLTGVSKFSKINLFSGLNNLLDITLDEQFSELCGYTQTELESVFTPELCGVDLTELKRWYNGYNWTGESVYNPFDVLLFLNSNKKAFKPYWIETGNATFLIDKLINEQVDIANLNNELADNHLLSSFEVGDISPIALMFQTGYLTINEINYGFAGETYTLKFPNMEVQSSLNQMMLNSYLGKKVNTLRNQSTLYNSLLTHDIDGLLSGIRAFFASIPYNWHTNNNIAHYEGYWASVFYALFASLGFTTIAEDSTSQGSVDMTLLINNHVYIFEFKVISKKTNQPTGVALNQIHTKQYADKYHSKGKVIHKIGVEFNEKTKEVIFDLS